MRKATAPLHQTAADTSAAVDAFMATLEHPCTALIEALRRIILRADPSIAEGIKWKSPSFRTGEYFATVNLRAKAGIGLILHFGAKVQQAELEYLVGSKAASTAMAENYVGLQL